MHTLALGPNSASNETHGTIWDQEVTHIRLIDQDDSLQFCRTNRSPNNDIIYASTVPSHPIPQTASLLSPLASIRQSQEVALPYTEEHELGDLSASIRAQTPDQQCHPDAAIPAGYALEVKRKTFVFEPIVPKSVLNQKNGRDAIMYVSSFAPRNPSQNVSPIDQGHVLTSCSKSLTMTFPCIYLEQFFELTNLSTVTVVKRRRQDGNQSHTRRVLFTSTITIGYVIMLNTVDDSKM